MSSTALSLTSRLEAVIKVHDCTRTVQRRHEHVLMSSMYNLKYVLYSTLHLMRFILYLLNAASYDMHRHYFHMSTK